MPTALLRHALRGMMVLLGVVTLTFLLLRMAPGNPALLLLGPNAGPEQVAVQERALGLDRPLPVQYGAWLTAFATGDWGRSIATGRPVRQMIGDAWPATLWLVGTSLLLSFLLGTTIGAVQSSRSGSRLDTALSVGTVTLFAMPSYWLALLLVLVFSYGLQWLPAFGAAGLDADFLSPGARLLDALRHAALPLVTLTLIGVGGIARYVRAAMLDVRGLPFVNVARAKGIAEARVTRRHVLRNALVPVVILLGLSLPALFSGAVFIEAIFAWPGVGRVLVQAVQARDYPVVMAAVAVSAALVVAGNMLADVLAALVDPVRRESESA
ncbi:MAG TPA: ABC transporter permease [Gemmatimonadales bacterium]|nr:ABC transporter permease [Gemmatimonadales bacterium]